MPILNYTTQVPVTNTVNDIQKALIKAGARAVLCEYDDHQEISAISFRVNDHHGHIHFRLPANVNGVEAALRKDRQFKNKAHTARVAWRILKDWIEAQMALIEANMAELPQVFLPYAQTKTGETIYEVAKANSVMILEGPKS